MEKYRNPRATEGESICNFVQTFGLSHLKRVLSCLTPPPFIDVSVYSVSIAEVSGYICTRVLGAYISRCFYDFSIRFRNCSDIVVFFFHFFLFLTICTTEGTCTMCNLFVENTCR